MSLAEYGQRKSIVVKGGVVIAGNGTHLAIEELGWTHVAVVSADDLTPEQAREYSIVDNQSSQLAHWDFGALTAHIKDIDPERRALLGFDPDEVKALGEGTYQHKWTGAFGGHGTGDPLTSGASFSFKATPEQAVIIKEAINKLKSGEGYDDITDGRALELISADFLAGA